MSRSLLLLLAVVLTGLLAPRHVAAQGAVVHAVLFYSPTCPHCHKVITEDLPPLVDKYGEQLVIAGVDVTTQQGQALYQATVQRFHITQDRLGVPTLVVGSEVMVGELEIPQRFPGLIEQGLAAGGIDWPPVDAIRQALSQQGMLPGQPAPRQADTTPNPVRTDTAPGMIPSPGVSQRLRGGTDTLGAPPTPAAPVASADTAPSVDSASSVDSTGAADSVAAASGAEAPPAAETGIGTLTEAAAPRGMAARFGLDPAANTIAVIILVGMLVAVFASVRSVMAGTPPTLVLPPWTLPLLAAVGMAVASYLALVEVTGAEAVCGPVGNCNAVQQSQWATLFGLPVGALGQAGYLAMFGAWILGVVGPPRWTDSAWLALWVMALVGTLFSAYLTFLEPFVIGATCLWCITSAVVMTLMLHAATPRARALHARPPPRPPLRPE